MARTTIPGNRLANGSIENRHLHPDFRISEDNIKFKYDPHEHKNKSTVLDILVNSIPQTLTTLDLKDILYTILEVSDAREANKTLKQTINSRASDVDVQRIVDELTEAKRGFATLNEFLLELELSIEKILANHMGAISHKDLDAMYSEVRAARDSYTSLKDRLDDIAANGGNGTGGTVNVNMLTPWNFQTTLPAGKTIVTLTNTYEPGNTTMQVFEGPILLQAGIDYEEKSPTEIEFCTPFDEDVEIRCVGVNTGRLFEWERRVLGDGFTKKIELTDSYRPGLRELMVYEDGLLLREDEDYVETSNHIITFNTAIEVGSTVTIYKRRA